jgi:hypothetical protein
VTTRQYSVTAGDRAFRFILEWSYGTTDEFLSLADTRTTLKVVHLVSQLCGIWPYSSFLRNDTTKNLSFAGHICCIAFF